MDPVIWKILLAIAEFCFIVWVFNVFNDED